MKICPATYSALIEGRAKISIMKKIDQTIIIEPGLLSLFRIFMWIQWSILFFAFCNLGNAGDVGAPVIVIISLCYSSLLLLYLRTERLQRWLKRVYLLIPLFIASFTPIFARALAIQTRIDSGLMGDASTPDAGTLILWLLAPLVAVAAQYGFVFVIIFCVATTGLELYFGALLAEIGSVPIEIIWEQAVIRNLIFLAMGFIISRLIKEQRRQRKSLREANQQLTQYAVTQEQLAVSRERNRMARDLHDTLAHTLSAVSIQLEAVTTVWETSPDVARQRIGKIQEITRDGLGETRRALQALRSSPLDDLGLVMAIRVMGAKASERAGFRFHFHAPDVIPELPAAIELNLYRIAEEAFNNVVQHAQAQDVWFRLEFDKKLLKLQIRDNGIGFDSDTDPPEGHFGLVGMTERAEICGGTIKIQSDPSAGTKINLELGIKQ